MLTRKITLIIILCVIKISAMEPQETSNLSNNTYLNFNSENFNGLDSVLQFLNLEDEEWTKYLNDELQVEANTKSKKRKGDVLISKQDIKRSKVQNFANNKAFIKRKLEFPIKSTPEKIKLEKDSIICPLCKRKFSRTDNLAQHIRAVHERRRDYLCRVCGKAFTEKGSLKRHTNTQHENKRFECKICNKLYTEKSRLNKHIRDIHDQGNEFRREKLKKTLENKHDLPNIKTNTQKKLYKCEACSRTYKKSSYLREHIMVTHTAQRSYACNDCSKVYKSREGLRYHRKHQHRQNLTTNIQNITTQENEINHKEHALNSTQAFNEPELNKEEIMEQEKRVIIKLLLYLNNLNQMN